MSVGTKRFSMKHRFFKVPPVLFDEHTAPDWLTGRTAVPGSTMDNSWFWERHVLTLVEGQAALTDFQIITRLPDVVEVPNE